MAEEESGGRSSSWQDLLPELLELIIQRLTSSDYRKCRYICTSWRTVVDNALASKGMCPPKPQFPCLMALYSSKRSRQPHLPPDVFATMLRLTLHAPFYQSTRCFILLFNHTRDICRMGSNLVSLRIQSLHGWIISWNFVHESKQDVYNTQVSIFNPLSRVRFKLPDLPSRFYKDPRWFESRFTRIQFASAPNSPEFLLVILIAVQTSYCRVQRLGFFRNNSWPFIESYEEEKLLLLDIALHGDKLYAVDMSITDYVYVFDLKDTNAITRERLVMMDPKPNLQSHGDYIFPVLAIDSSSGELFLVLRVHHCLGDIVGFRVFRFDIAGPRWSEIEHLGHRSLFYDGTRITIISTKGLNDGIDNCVLFSIPKYDTHVRSDHQVGIFSLVHKTIIPVDSPSAFVDRHIWFSDPGLR